MTFDDPLWPLLLAIKRQTSYVNLHILWFGPTSHNFQKVLGPPLRIFEGVPPTIHRFMHQKGYPWIYLGVPPRIKRIAVEGWLHVRKVGCEKDGERSIVNVQSKAQLP